MAALEVVECRLRGVPFAKPFVQNCWPWRAAPHRRCNEFGRRLALPMFFRKIFGLKPTNQKALRDEISGSCPRRISGLRSRKNAEPGGNNPGTPPSTIEIFQSFETPDPRAGAFGASLLLHVGILLLLMVLPLMFTSSLKLNYVALVDPPIEKAEPPVETTLISPRTDHPLEIPPAIRYPTRSPGLVVTQPAVEAAEPLRTRPPHSEPTNEIRIPKSDKPELPLSLPAATPRIAAPEPASIVPAPPKIPVRMGVFSETDGSNAAPNTVQHDVQTGGFSDPSGAPASNSHRAAGVAAIGAFGAAAAPLGYRASAGQTVRQSGFEPPQPAPSPSAPKKNDTGPPDKPVEVIFKPKPDYTEEARKLHVEGEVLVHVLFKASGEISVLDVVHGLGHGLDEAAVHAAQQIRFKPALRAGQAVDWTATVHIIFQLAF
jgi:TonB family protein